MTERPILFSGDMVRALREGRKTQTRRTRGLEAINAEPDAWECDGGEFDPLGWRFNRAGDPHADGLLIRCPYGVAGDRLWTRECFSTEWNQDSTWKGTAYRADELMWDADYRWRPSIHMPRCFSRNTLEMVSVRPERLQAIARSDCEAEGVQIPVEKVSGPPVTGLLRVSGSYAPITYFPPDYNGGKGLTIEQRTDIWLRAHYASLWDSINGKKLPWSKNPWVWRVEFRVLTTA